MKKPATNVIKMMHENNFNGILLRPRKFFFCQMNCETSLEIRSSFCTVKYLPNANVHVDSRRKYNVEL